MLYKSRAIALHSIKYGDTSIITHVYSEQFGRLSFLIKGVYGKKAGIKANIFAPLNLLELEINRKTGRELNSLKEAVINPVYQTIHSDPVKNTLSFFLAEVLYRILQEEMPNENLFNYIFNAFQLLDFENPERIANFHIVFLLGISKYAGFFPENNFSTHEKFFDLINGKFVAYKPEHGHFIPQELSGLWVNLLQSNFENAFEIQLDKNSRLTLLDKIIEFYYLHIPGMGKIKSLQVMKEIFE